MSQASFASSDDGLGAVGNLKLAEDAGNVVADGLRTEVEAVGDLGVGVTGGDQVENLSFTVGEVRKRQRRRGRLRREKGK